MKEDCLAEEFEEDWICDIVRTTYRNYKGRKVVIWGKYGVAERIAKGLKDRCQILVYGYIESNQSKVGDCVFYVSDFFEQARKEDYYIVVPLARRPEVVETLTKNGFIKGTDYYYFAECVLEQRENYYEDAHGNKIIGKTEGTGQIIFLGFHATVIIHENTVFPNTAKIYIHSGASLEIGANTRITFQSYTEIGKGAKVTIGADCLLRSIKYMYIKPNAELVIGDKTTTWYGCCINVCEWSKIKIGYDCMFSHDIKVYSNDCHSIFDITTGKNINSTEEICKKRNVEIGDHVWIGMDAIILYGSKIKSGSIIGAGSVVKGEVPENCIACGNPARVTRRNVGWSRKNCAEWMS